MKRDKLGHTQAYPLACAAPPCIHQLSSLSPSTSIYSSCQNSSRLCFFCVCAYWRTCCLCIRWPVSARANACLAVQRKWCGTLHPPYNSPGLIEKAKELFPAPATHSNGLASVNKSCSYPCSGQIRGEGDLQSDGSRRGSQSSSLPSTTLPP